MHRDMCVRVSDDQFLKFSNEQHIGRASETDSACVCVYVTYTSKHDPRSVHNNVTRWASSVAASPDRYVLAVCPV